MTEKQPPSVDERVASAKDVARAGSFAADGRWLNRGRRSPLWYFVDGLVGKRRRQPKLPPAHFADHIATHRAGSFATAFPSLGNWHKLERSIDWQFVNPRSSAESAVVFCIVDPENGVVRSHPPEPVAGQVAPELLTPDGILVEGDDPW